MLTGACRLCVPQAGAPPQPDGHEPWTQTVHKEAPKPNTAVGSASREAQGHLTARAEATSPTPDSPAPDSPPAPASPKSPSPLPAPAPALSPASAPARIPADGDAAATAESPLWARGERVGHTAPLSGEAFLQRQALRQARREEETRRKIRASLDKSPALRRIAGLGTSPPGGAGEPPMQPHDLSAKFGQAAGVDTSVDMVLAEIEAEARLSAAESLKVTASIQTRLHEQQRSHAAERESLAARHAEAMAAHSEANRVLGEELALARSKAATAAQVTMGIELRLGEQERKHAAQRAELRARHDADAAAHEAARLELQEQLAQAQVAMEATAAEKQELARRLDEQAREHAAQRGDLAAQHEAGISEQKAAKSALQAQLEQARLAAAAHEAAHAQLQAALGQQSQEHAVQRKELQARVQSVTSEHAAARQQLEVHVEEVRVTALRAAAAESTVSSMEVNAAAQRVLEVQVSEARKAAETVSISTRILG